MSGWTAETPKQSGWYWWFTNRLENYLGPVPAPVRVHVVRGEVYWEVPKVYWEVPYDHFIDATLEIFPDSMWLGPIPEPECPPP